MQLSSRILTALAVLILAVTVVAVRAGSPGTVEAATGDISVLNVGTCYTTNTDAFAVGACKDGQLEEQDDGEPADTAYNVGGRDSITKVDTVYATYAIDPKTSGDQPRAILKNSDLIKISIEDAGRDKRTGKLYAVEGATAAGLETVPAQLALNKTLGDLIDDLEMIDHDTSPSTPMQIGLSSAPEQANFNDGGATTILASGLYSFRLTGPASTTHPMAPKDDGKVFWFGTAGPQGTPGDLRDLTGEFIELDEDLNSGTFKSIAPWMRVSAQVPADVVITVQYIYYQTSKEEDLIGGRKSKANDDPDDDASETDNELYPSGAEQPDFVDAEVKTETNPDPDPLVLRVSADGRDPSMNLWLTEKSRFSGVYEGYARLTDADGDGTNEDVKTRDNWGLTAGDATGSGSGKEQYAVIGVESGPVTITYKNSKGDTRTISITIDREPPSIQVDSPIDGTASTDDSPELIGTFTDGGGSGLREESFKIYADNTPDENIDNTPVWGLGVLGPVAGTDANRLDRGQVCVDALDADGNDGSDGECDASSSAASLRAHYAGYTSGAGTFGIIYSSDVYRNTDDMDGDTEEDLKTADAEEFEDGDVNGEFDTIVRIDFDPGEANDGRYNHIVDIQAVVMDIAGNIGFSDSDPSGPIFIHDLGTASADRDADDKHNVIGVYSRHVYYLDDVDPEFEEDESATGFFPNSDGDQDHNNFGALIVFDGKVDPATVGVGTFEVSLDNGSDAAVVDVAVDGDKVYLLLEEELAPDATPQVALASGQSIADLAGNESTDRRLDGIELSDGILPVFTVTLSGGTGLNEDIDGEGPSEITKSQMKVSITSNEAIQGSPKFSVVCSNLTWGKAADENAVGSFASNRTGAKKSQDLTNAEPAAKHNTADVDSDPDDASVPAAERTMCPDHVLAADDPEDVTTFFYVSETSALARPGNNWEYQWSNLPGDNAVEDGELSVIVWGRDRSSYMRGDARVFNYSAATTNFVYDTDLMTAWAQVKQESVERELVPDEGEDVFEVRPFVLLDFGDEGTTVDVTTFEVDGTDYTADLLAIEDNEFVWWPEPLSYGTYKVYVEANDAANNTGDHTYSFAVKARAAFVLDLLAGWNSISFPANPIDRALHAVFTNTAIDQVIGWNVTEPVSPWRMATRVDGVWTTNDEFATLNDVEARYGYWVHSTGFITQAVDLAGKGDRSTDGQPNPSDIPTDEGWNFVGVVDVDGDQTQDDAGETLRNSNNDPITAAEYLGNYTRAYTWDHINNTWDVVKNSEGITIGTGVWVYYTSDHDIAP